MAYFPAGLSLEDVKDKLEDELEDAYERIAKLESALLKIQDTPFSEFSISEVQAIARRALGVEEGGK